ncbi:MAG: hypothetical protein JXR35_00035 [Rhodobacteraceae bacterium]|nr:hypothetical protein [Paracoccaceae bacterium]
MRLPLELIALIEQEAHAFDTSPAEVMRRVLRIGLTPATEPDDDFPPISLPEMAALQEALDLAEGRIDLQMRLRRTGLVLRAGGPDGCLGVHEWPSDRFLIALDEIGPSLGELVLRYHAPFPGRPLCKSNRSAEAMPLAAQDHSISRRFVLPQLRPAA